MDRSRPEGTSFLYSRFKLQCNQCGLRFFDSKLGKNKMDIHLDWHFTHKRRIREGAGRSQGRTWFTQEDVSLIFLSLSSSLWAISIDVRLLGENRIGINLNQQIFMMMKRLPLLPLKESNLNKLNYSIELLS